MAKFVLKNPIVRINGVDLSDHFSEIAVETSRDEVEVTSFGAAFKEFLAGLGDATMTGNVFQDFAAGEVDSTLWPLSTSDTPFEVAIRATSAVISATNPEYQMQALRLTYSPISGSVGEASTTEVTFRNAAQTGVVRDVTP